MWSNQLYLQLTGLPYQPAHTSREQNSTSTKTTLLNSTASVPTIVDAAVSRMLQTGQSIQALGNGDAPDIKLDQALAKLYAPTQSCHACDGK